MTATATKDRPTTPTHRLTAQDRCDRCGAQAYLEVTSSTTGLTLLFCGHHGRKHEDALATTGFKFHDERTRLADEAAK